MQGAGQDDVAWCLQFCRFCFIHGFDDCAHSKRHTFQVRIQAVVVWCAIPRQWVLEHPEHCRPIVQGHGQPAALLRPPSLGHRHIVQKCRLSPLCCCLFFIVAGCITDCSASVGYDQCRFRFCPSRRAMVCRPRPPPPAPRPPSYPEFQPSHHVSSATHVSHPHLHFSFTLFFSSYSLPSIYFTLFSRSNIICNCQESLAPVVPHSRLTRESSFQVYKTSDVLSANIQKQQQRPAPYSLLKITELV